MKRYIDADWIYEKVENRYRVSSGIEHRCERDLLDLICAAPDVDVVPKSEVEELKAIIKDHQANEERWQEFYADTVNKWEKAYEELEIELENAKADFAREIFEEIESVLCTFKYPSLTALGKITVISAEGWHIRAGDYSTIKKKYTEGEDGTHKE